MRNGNELYFFQIVYSDVILITCKNPIRSIELENGGGKCTQEQPQSSKEASCDDHHPVTESVREDAGERSYMMKV